MQTEVTAVLAGNFFSSVKQQEMLLRVLFNIIMGYCYLHFNLYLIILILLLNLLLLYYNIIEII